MFSGGMVYLVDLVIWFIWSRWNRLPIPPHTLRYGASPVRFRYVAGPVRFLYPNEIAKAFHPVYCVTGQVGQAGQAPYAFATGQAPYTFATPMK